MEIVEKAIETTATINSNRQLVLRTTAHYSYSTKVRVIILLPEGVDIDEKEGGFVLQV